MSPDDRAEPADGRAVAVDWLSSFERFLSVRDIDAVLELCLGDYAWWRDVYALDWDITAHRGRAGLRALLERRLAVCGLGAVALDADRPVRWRESYLEVPFTFETRIGGGRGIVRLVRDVVADRWRAWTVATSLETLHAVPPRVVTAADLTLDSADVALEPGEREAAAVAACRRREYLDDGPSVLVVGGGHCGLFLAARLERLGVPTLVVEARDRVGDTWRDRYSGLMLHETKWSMEFPYLRFPDTWPLLTPKDMLADWMEAYARLLQLDVWTGSTVRSAVFRADEQGWDVVVERDGQGRAVRARHLVFATGHHGRPAVPPIAGAEEFSGTITHSAHHRGGPEMSGARVVVVGAGSSGLDVAQDAFEHGATVTLVQRGPTHVLSQRHGIPAYHAAYLAEPRMGVEDADLLTASVPLRLAFEMSPPLTRQIAEADRDLLEGLERVGFETTLGPRDTGMLHMTYVRGGGYYIDRGAAQLLVDGRVAVTRAAVDRFSSSALVLSDGSTVPADVVVLCTGYVNMRESARPILGDEVTERLATVWGLDEDGELRTTFRHSGHERLWFVAGGFRDARIYSQHVALTIAAMERGLVDPGVSVTHARRG